MRENQISSPQDLKVGQKIIIPSVRRRKSSSSFLWPIEGEVVNFFGESVNNSVNKGLNIKATSGNREVNASEKGRVVEALKAGANNYIVKPFPPEALKEKLGI